MGLYEDRASEQEQLFAAFSAGYRFGMAAFHGYKDAELQAKFDMWMWHYAPNFDDPKAVYCWENIGCGKRLLCIIDGKRLLDIFPDTFTYEVESDEIDLPPGTDLTLFPVYGTYNREFTEDGEDVYSPVGPLLTVAEIKALLCQEPYAKLDN